MDFRSNSKGADGYSMQPATANMAPLTQEAAATLRSTISTGGDALWHPVAARGPGCAIAKSWNCVAPPE